MHIIPVGQSGADTNIGRNDTRPPEPGARSTRASEGASRDASSAEAAEQNRLLRLLPAAEYARLLPSLETVPLALRQVLYEQNAPIPHVYFPQHGVLSVVKVMTDGDAVEVATMGSEGMAGLPVFLGGVSPAETFVQIAGEAKRMSAAAFREAASPGSPLHAVLQCYTEALFSQLMQSVACNRLHSVQQRCARWLLMTHDRVGGADEFPLTQQFLSFMLGVRRAGVTVAASTLQEAGLIRYSRGKITVLDRAGLEAASCECYRTVRADFDRLLA